MKVFSFLFYLVLFTISCSNNDVDDGVTTSDCKPVIISNSIFQSFESNQINVVSLSLDADCLTVSLGVSGCDADHIIDMVSDGGIDESLPVQITFDFQDETPQDCEAYFEIDQQFDLASLNDLVDGDILIRFRNSDRSILYEN